MRVTTTDIFLYVLALAARRYDVRVHAACVLSNHCHLVLTDTRCQLPRFMQYLDSLVARAVNASLGRFEGFWATDGSYSAVEPIDPADVVGKVAYVLANPVAAGLVRRGAQWPGLWTAPVQLGAGTLTARKPKIFFAAKSHLPAAIDLELTVPPGFASADEFRSAVSTELLEGAGRRFLGVARVLAQAPFARPRPTCFTACSAQDPRRPPFPGSLGIVWAHASFVAAWRRRELFASLHRGARRRT